MAESKEYIQWNDFSSCIVVKTAVQILYFLIMLNLPHVLIILVLFWAEGIFKLTSWLEPIQQLFFSTFQTL